MQNLIPINLVVGDRTYRIKINSNDEEQVRKMAKKLNDQLSEFRSQYAGKDMQDYLAMVLLSLVTEQQTGKQPENIAESQEQLNRIETLIDRALED
jgi:cell division protein ZapA (FtsZ GTPase activity inhibitor)